MKASSIYATGQFRKLPPRSRSMGTDFYIFDKREQHLFEVDNVHFKAKTHTSNLPIIVNGSQGEMEWIAKQMIATTGTIWEMTQLFIDGATIRFPDKSLSVTIYKRILDHMDAHLNAMRTVKMYEAPDVEDFRQMAEFASAIRTLAFDVDPLFEHNRPNNQMVSFIPQRATFSKREADEVKEITVPKAVARMDIIERFLEMRDGG